MRLLLDKPINKTKVLVAMSGGVDSSVVAILLKRLGYDVTGVTLSLAHSSCGLGACCTGPDLTDVKTMCNEEGFDHHLVIAREHFKERVINYTAQSYAEGFTPSPCVWCNSTVRFDHLHDTMVKLGCDLFVTGHYAHIGINSNTETLSSTYSLLAGVDPNKDQSYFLSMLPKHMLSKVRFPLGNMKKTTVRRIARAFGLKAAAKKDSQDLCFVKENYAQTLWNINPDIFKPGNIKNTSGEIIGQHDGIAQYTIGQRKGIKMQNREMTSNTQPLYVVDINQKKNSITIGDQKYTATTHIYLTKVNLIEDFYEGMFVKAKIRARSDTFMARLWLNGTLIVFCLPILNVARGQICVIYKGRKVIGAGLISNFIRYKKQHLC